MKHTLGDAPIEPKHHDQMNALARALDEIFNGAAKGADRKTGFVLLVFPFGNEDGRCNYISNGADRRDIVTMFKEQIKRFEGQPDMNMEDIGAAAEMPRYLCHKQVWALKIKLAEIEVDGVTITPEEPGYAPFKVSHRWWDSHNAHIGGYYVVYKDGYKSFSPANVFEDGYTRI